MAFGFPASFSDHVELNLSRRAAREAVSHTLGLLDWPFETPDNDTFRAKIKLSPASWGERITISLSEPGMLEIRSVCLYPLQLFDWGKNKQNVTRFLALFEPKAAREAKLPREEPQHFDSDGKTPVERALKEDEALLRPYEGEMEFDQLPDTLEHLYPEENRKS